MDGNPLIDTDSMGLAPNQACVVAATATGGVIGGIIGSCAGGIVGGVVGGAGGTLVIPGGGTVGGGAAGAAAGSSAGGAAGAAAGAAAGNAAGQLLCPDDDECNEQLKRCLESEKQSKQGSVYGSSRCLWCAEGCKRNGGTWPKTVPTPRGGYLSCKIKPND